MARRKKVEELPTEVVDAAVTELNKNGFDVVKKPTKPEVEPDFNQTDEANAPKVKAIETRVVRKAIENPLRLNDHIILSDFKDFTIPGNLLINEMFMLHIEYLIELKKLERV